MKVYRTLVNEKRDFAISRQILRSGTSIGANVEEALGAQSDKDFLSKISIAYKEARETGYWLRLLKSSKWLEVPVADDLQADCEELLKILGSIQISVKKKIRNHRSNSPRSSISLTFALSAAFSSWASFTMAWNSGSSRRLSKKGSTRI